MRRNRHKGFSLVEILIAMTVFGIVAASVSSLVMANSRLQRESRQDIAAQEYVDRYMERLKRLWLIPDRYRDSRLMGNLDRPPAGYAFRDLVISVTCIDTGGIELAGGCDTENVPLKRVEVSLVKGDDVAARAWAEIGEPYGSQEED